MTEQLYLKWNFYSLSFTKQSKKLFLKDGLSDGTIFCDGRFYPIHRFILSSCSEYFEEVFDKSFHISNKETFIIIKDIAAEQMEALLNYMYLGEVHVSQENLPQLIKAAEALKIRGLGVPDEEDTEPTGKSNRKRLKSMDSVAPSPQKTKRTEENQESNFLNSENISYQSNIFLPDDIKSEPVDVDLESMTTNQEDLVKEEFKDVGGIFASEEIVEVQNINFDYQPSDSLQKDKMEGDDMGSLEQDYTEFNNDENISGQAKDEGSLEHDDTEFSNDDPIDENQPSCSTNNSNCSYNSFVIGGLEQLQCTICPFKCSRRGILQNHLRTHAGEKPFKCPICFSKFSYKGALKTHILNHNKGKSYKCTFCSYSTSYKCNLNDHVRTHTGQKPYKCSLCPYKSTQSAHLKRHYRTHTGEKPYMCSQCSYRSSHNNSLKFHIKKFHN